MKLCSIFWRAIYLRHWRRCVKWSDLYNKGGGTAEGGQYQTDLKCGLKLSGTKCRGQAICRTKVREAMKFNSTDKQINGRSWTSSQHWPKKLRVHSWGRHNLLDDSICTDTNEQYTLFCVDVCVLIKSEPPKNGILSNFKGIVPDFKSIPIACVLCK